MSKSHKSCRKHELFINQINDKSSNKYHKFWIKNYNEILDYSMTNFRHSFIVNFTKEMVSTSFLDLFPPIKYVCCFFAGIFYEWRRDKLFCYELWGVILPKILWTKIEQALVYRHVEYVNCNFFKLISCYNF